MIRQAKRLANLSLSTWREAGVYLREKFASANPIEIPFIDLKRPRGDIHSDNFAGRVNDVGTPRTASIVSQSHRATKQGAHSIAQPRIDLVDANGGRITDAAILSRPFISVTRAFALINASSPYVVHFLSGFRRFQSRVSIVSSRCSAVTTRIPIALARAKSVGISREFNREFLTTLLTDFRRPSYFHKSYITQNNYHPQSPSGGALRLELF